LFGLSTGGGYGSGVVLFVVRRRYRINKSNAINTTTTMIFTTLKIVQTIINPCRTLAMITKMVVAREVKRARILRITVIASPAQIY
jgi:hypothetical protein